MIPSDILRQVTPEIAAFLDYSASKVGVCEDPPGSNRGPDIDEWAKEFGSPLGSFWCALAVGHCRKRHGLWIPPAAVGSCDEWVFSARRSNLWSKTPVIGAAVVYTNWKRLDSGRYAGQYDAVHIGTVLRTLPVPFAYEGNTTLGKYDRNGYALTLKEIEQSRVYGYVLPAPRAEPARGAA